MFEEQMNPNTNTNAYSSPSSFGKYWGGSNSGSSNNSPVAISKDVQKQSSTSGGNSSSWSKFALGTAVSLFKDMTSGSASSSGSRSDPSSVFNSSGVRVGSSANSAHLQNLYNVQSKQLQGTM